jgi:hypothetical protein
MPTRPLPPKAMCLQRALRAEVSKHFFFEKKKQKTFIRYRGHFNRSHQKVKVFWFFFSKKNILPYSLTGLPRVR